MIALLLSAFTLGLLGSLHCMGMCGPLVMSMPFQKAKNGNVLGASINYHIGKALSYSLLGIVAGSIGQTFAFFKWQQVLSILSGILLLLITFLPYLKNKIQLGNFLQKGFSKLFAQSNNETNSLTFLGFGFLNGFLPCGLVYTAIAAAAVSASAFNGAMFMLFFGLGTIPSLTSIILFNHKMSVKVKSFFSKSSRYISIFIGLLLILRGFNLGIPYVSPHLNQDKQEMDCCHPHHKGK